MAISTPSSSGNTTQSKNVTPRTHTEEPRGEAEGEHDRDEQRRPGEPEHLQPLDPARAPEPEPDRHRAGDEAGEHADHSTQNSHSRCPSAQVPRPRCPPSGSERRRRRRRTGGVEQRATAITPTKLTIAAPMRPSATGARAACRSGRRKRPRSATRRASARSPGRSGAPSPGEREPRAATGASAERAGSRIHAILLRGWSGSRSAGRRSSARERRPTTNGTARAGIHPCSPPTSSAGRARNTVVAVATAHAAMRSPLHAAIFASSGRRQYVLARGSTPWPGRCDPGARADVPRNRRPTVRRAPANPRERGAR